MTTPVKQSGEQLEPIREALRYYRDHQDLNNLQRSHAERALDILDSLAFQNPAVAEPSADETEQMPDLGEQ